MINYIFMEICPHRLSSEVSVSLYCGTLWEVSALYSDQNKDSPRTLKCQSRGRQSHWSEAEARGLASLGCSTDRASTPKDSHPYSSLQKDPFLHFCLISHGVNKATKYPCFWFSFPQWQEERLESRQSWIKSETSFSTSWPGTPHYLLGHKPFTYLSARSFLCQKTRCYIRTCIARPVCESTQVVFGWWTGQPCLSPNPKHQGNLTVNL